MTAVRAIDRVPVPGSSRRAAAVPPLRVMLLISSLEPGGAERQVLELARTLDGARFDPLICSLADRVPLARDLPDRDRRLAIVPKRWRYDVTTIRRVARIVAERRIGLVHAFLFDAEMVARVLRRIGAVPVVVGSERNSDHAFGAVKSSCLRLTRSWLDAVIANSEAGRRLQIQQFGVAPERVHVVRNGVDAERFRRTDGSAVRRALGVPDSAPLVGMVASFKRQKRHEDFLHAARLILDRVPDAWFVCAGEPLRDNQQGAADYHAAIRTLTASLGLDARVRFAGHQDEMPAVYSACDVTVLPSSREGTPNVLLESMACEVPVVATDIADNAAVVREGETGFLVPLGSPAEISARTVRILSERALAAAMGRCGRAWVQRMFSTAELARQTEAVYAAAWLHRTGGEPAAPQEAGA